MYLLFKVLVQKVIAHTTGACIACFVISPMTRVSCMAHQCSPSSVNVSAGAKLLLSAISYMLFHGIDPSSMCLQGFPGKFPGNTLPDRPSPLYKTDICFDVIYIRAEVGITHSCFSDMLHCKCCATNPLEACGTYDWEAYTPTQQLLGCYAFAAKSM